MDSEEVTNEVVGQARVEEVGLKLFNSADKQDRAGKFDKNVVKSFFTSHYMLLIVKGLGGLTEEVEAKQRYARWKAVEIDRCLKNGIPPTPGPPGEGGGELSEQTVSPFPEEQLQPSARPTPKPRSLPPEPGPQPLYPPAYPLPPPTLEVIPPPAADATNAPTSLPPEVVSEAQKKCKFASSALDYDDVGGAIAYLTEALELLKKPQ
jgi:vacuolar protein sorting-associated protein VTA1